MVDTSTDPDGDERVRADQIVDYRAVVYSSVCPGKEVRYFSVVVLLDRTSIRLAYQAGI